MGRVREDVFEEDGGCLDEHVENDPVRHPQLLLFHVSGEED